MVCLHVFHYTIYTEEIKDLQPVYLPQTSENSIDVSSFRMVSFCGVKAPSWPIFWFIRQQIIKEITNMSYQSDSVCFNTGKRRLVRYLRALYVSGTAIILFTMLGCALGSSMSESSGSISESFSSSFRSSKSSSEERKEAYQGDIRHYTEVYTRSNGDVAGFAKGLSFIGEKYGTTNWEADNSTYVGIGQGLAKAGIPQRRIDTYMTRLAQGDPLKIAALRKGFGQEP